MFGLSPKIMSQFRASIVEACDPSHGGSGGLDLENPVAMQGDDLSFFTQGFGAKFFATCGAENQDFSESLKAAFGGASALEAVRALRQTLPQRRAPSCGL